MAEDLGCNYEKSELHQKANALMNQWLEIVESSPESLYPEYDFNAQCELAKGHQKKMEEGKLNIRVGLKVDFSYKDLESYTNIFPTDDPLLVSLLAKRYLECIDEESKCVGVKHFPNLIHSQTKDPHVLIDKSIALDLSQLEIDSIKPMLQSVASKACTIMVSHIPVIGEDGKNKICTLNPSCISFIREGMNFDELIITDELQVMKPVLFEVWDQKYRPSDPEAQKEWDKIMWSPNFEIFQFSSDRTGEENRKLYYENKKKEFDKRYTLVFKTIANKRCSPKGECSPTQIKEINSELMDEDVSQRSISALKAGNDMIMVFQEGGKQKKRLSTMIPKIVEAIEDKTLDEEQINQSVLRVLRRKEKTYGDDLYKNFDFSDENKTPEEILKTLSREEKVKQLLIISAASPGETPLAYNLEVGAAYYFNYATYPEHNPTPYRPKIPLLRMGDFPGLID